MLPVIESRDDINLEQFAKKTQTQIATSLQIPHTDVTTEDIKTWRSSEYSSIVCFLLFMCEFAVFCSYRKYLGHVSNI